MRLLFSVLVALVAFSGAALADPFANFYGNTVKVSGAAGERSVFIDVGGSYSQKLPDGSTAEGKYTVEGDTACFLGGEQPYCVPAEARNVGDSWELTAPDGSKETATLVAGR
ncbi:hypothetical protein [Parvibaculum sp.]|uniref:hypothetical protein n=1 Tax=Parvibaculum sp. TaxID=2024848 RepID=UPI0027317784|nr:hypothetical protein [Parvibaculum sp.]MDP1627010.1 hypothetical protein [Parvibaculum sp.]MDP2149804.1 hypothetical protein [Parvibaculum sp.]MDP3327248.1 hypothetical protein [Parvibaculum sp.]